MPTILRSTTFPLPPAQTPCVLVTHEYAPFRGGVATFVQEIARAVRAGGGSVEVWTVDYRGRGEVLATPTASDSNAGVPVVRLASDGRLTPRGLLAFAWGIWRRRGSLRGRPVVLLSVGAQMAFFLLDALRAVSPGNVTCFFHGSEVLRFGRSPFWRVLARRFYARAGEFGANSFHVEQLLRGSGLLPEGARITLARCAVPSAFAAFPVTGRSDDFYRVLTVARLHPRKGQVEVARALARLPAAQRETVLYQVAGVGEETYRREIEAACRGGGVRCQFLGALDDASLARAYASATVYAQASRTLPRSVEGFGITFLEASFHGCPVAAFRSGGVDEAVRDGVTGLLVPEGDESALAAAISRLLADPELRARMGAEGRAFARSFSWEQAAKDLFETALQK